MVKSDVIKKFEKMFGVKMIIQEAGFGETVCGFIKGWIYISYNKDICKSIPNKAYSHSNILAVNYESQEDINILSDWCEEIMKNECVLRAYENGYKGVQAQECGRITYILEKKE